MRKMVYRLDNGTIVNTFNAAAGHSYKVVLETITPFDEVAARIKFNKARQEQGLRLTLPIHY